MHGRATWLSQRLPGAGADHPAETADFARAPRPGGALIDHFERYQTQYQRNVTGKISRKAHHEAHAGMRDVFNPR